MVKLQNQATAALRPCYEELAAQLPAQEQLGIDSLLMVDMMLDLETGLGFSFESMDLPRNPDLDTIVALVDRNMARKSAG